MYKKIILSPTTANAKTPVTPLPGLTWQPPSQEHPRTSLWSLTWKQTYMGLIWNLESWIPLEVVDCKTKIKTEKITDLRTSNNLVLTSTNKIRDLHKCSKCGEEFSDPKGVKRYIRHHNRNLGFKCKGLNCIASYAAAQFVERHK